MSPAPVDPTVTRREAIGTAVAAAAVLGPAARPAASKSERTVAKRVDVHHHFLPDFYVRALEAAGRSPPDGMPATPKWGEADAVAAMDRLGVGTAMLSISSPGVHFGDDAKARALARRTNEEAARLAKAHPGRFGFFASTPLPDVAGAVAEVKYAFDTLGADGVAFETNFAGTYLGDAVLAPLYRELDRRKAVVFLHPTSSPCQACATADLGGPGEGARPRDVSLGYPLPMLEFIFETTRSVVQLLLSGTLARYPNVKVIVPHAGAALSVLAGRIELLMRYGMKAGPGAPADVRAALKELHYDLAGAPVPELLSALLQVADPAKLHYGSDWPFTPTDVCKGLADKLDATGLLSDEVRDGVMTRNARRLFPRRFGEK